MSSLNMHVVTSNLQEKQLHRTSKHKKSYDNCDLLGHYTAGSSNYPPTFRENLWFPSWRVKNPIILGLPLYPVSSGCSSSTFYTRRI